MGFKNINRKTKRIYCIAIAHSEANLPIVDIQINYASGIILVLDAEKDEDQDQVSLYLQHMRKNSATSQQIKQKKIFLCNGFEDKELIEEIEELDPTVLELRPADQWFENDKSISNFVDEL